MLDTKIRKNVFTVAAFIMCRHFSNLQLQLHLKSTKLFIITSEHLYHHRQISQCYNILEINNKDRNRLKNAEVTTDYTQ
ncbi:unnamed protein product [Allacma fusca]|uniref:Uncharacterized protein n=1 Tax=Allacma fusca TaxID=39272 RepID=A0A8J2PGE7_9HEXA|nr:unnamed protein product [Allacma fusca]